MAVNRMLRSEIGVETDREYTLLSYEVFTGWKNDAEQHAFASPPGATDDFRYGMALNPHMRAFITHGQYDLVTPYYASDRLRNLMRLDPQMADRLTVQHYGGGHMFYAWETSRHAFTAAIAAFVDDAVYGGLAEIRVGQALRRAQEPALFDPLLELGLADKLESNEQDRMPFVVRGLEEHARARGDRELLLVRIDPKRECALSMSVGTDPREELAADLERRLAVGRRLLGAGERRRDRANRLPVRHQPARAMYVRREPLRRLDEPRFLEALAELLPVDRLEADLDSGPPVVVRAREVHVRIRVEDQRLLVPLDPDPETAAVSLACGPCEELPAHAERDPILARLLGLGKRERKLANRVPVDHLETLTTSGERGSTGTIPRVPAMEPAESRRVELILPMRTVIVVAAAIGLMAAFAAIGDTFLIVFVGIFLAFVFEYPVRFVMEKTPMSRGLAATVTVLGTALAVVGLMLLLLVPLVGSVRDFLQDLPALVEELRASDELASWLGDSGAAGNVQEGAEQVSVSIPDAISSVLGIAGSFFTVFLAGFTILFICLFLLTDVGNLKRSLTSVLMPGEDDRWLLVWERVTETISRWAIGVIVIATIAGTIQGTTAWLLGSSYASRSASSRGCST